METAYKRLPLNENQLGIMRLLHDGEMHIEELWRKICRRGLWYGGALDPDFSAIVGALRRLEKRHMIRREDPEIPAGQSCWGIAETGRKQLELRAGEQ